MLLNFRHQRFLEQLSRATFRNAPTRRQLNRLRGLKPNQYSGTSIPYGFGPPSPKLPINHPELPNQYQQQHFLSLPKGFCYSVVSYAGETMCDGNRVPTNHGSMAAFRGSQGTTVVLRNHNLSDETNKVQVKNGSCYDVKRSGGTSTLVFNRRGRLCMHHGSLAGTDSNQTGGPTPWDTWLSCESNFSTGAERHGYIFEIPSDGFAEAQPIRHMGRFAHGGVAVDSRSGFVYMTENRADGLFYRFRPNRCGELYAGGTLEALQVDNLLPETQATLKFFENSKELPRVKWVSIRQPDPDTEFGSHSTRAQGQNKGASIFNQSKGPWCYKGLIYFTSLGTEAYSECLIWAFDPEKGTITPSPAPVIGTLVYALERDRRQSLPRSYHEFAIDPVGRIYHACSISESSRILATNTTGETFEIAINRFNKSNFSGLCFSPSGRFMFANISDPGITFVVHGPWRREFNSVLNSTPHQSKTSAEYSLSTG